MAYLEPLEAEKLAELKPILAMSEATMGFVPNSILTMAHMRQLPVAFSMLFGTVMGADVKVLMENLIKGRSRAECPGRKSTRRPASARRLLR